MLNIDWPLASRVWVHMNMCACAGTPLPPHTHGRREPQGRNLGGLVCYLFWKDKKQRPFVSEGAERQSRLIRELIFVDPESPRKGETVEYKCMRPHSTHQQDEAWRVRANKRRAEGLGYKGSSWADGNQLTTGNDSVKSMVQSTSYIISFNKHSGIWNTHCALVGAHWYETRSCVSIIPHSKLLTVCLWLSMQSPFLPSSILLLFCETFFFLSPSFWVPFCLFFSPYSL